MAYPFPTVEANTESSPDGAAPRRPAAVPHGAEWDAEVGKWEVTCRDAAGVRDGECLHYRNDGTLYSRSRVVAGVREGAFAIYHRNGGVAREGRYVAGRLDGTVTAYASDDPAGEKLRTCCVPPGAARLSERWRSGDFLLEVFYDGQGRAILSDGRLCPVRPAELPELAQFDESRGGWALRSRELDRFWNVDGGLTEEVVHGEGGARIIRRFDGGGGLVQENGVGAEDRLDGPFFRRLAGADPSPYADARVRQERGAYADGQAVGVWRYLDDGGNLVREIDCGVAFRDGADARSLTAAPDDGDWWSRARALVADGHVREALVAAARGAVAGRDRAALERFRAEHTVRLNADSEAQWGAALAQSTDATAATILNALVCGADAAASYRTLASVLPGTDAAASDLVEASLLLAPDRRLTHLTRALLRFQRGDVAGALADADVVAGESTEAAESLRSYGAMIFRRFDDWPGREPFAPDPELEGVTLELTHVVDDVRHLVAVYATRIARSRAAIRALAEREPGEQRKQGEQREQALGEAAWWPPETSHLLPSGPVALRRETITCDPDPDAAADATPETIELDEELVTAGAAVPTLLAAAHADWAALSWLCWGVGLRDVGLPDGVEPPADLAAAMKLFVRRTWRIKDRLGSGSLISRSQGVPGFEWQGVDIDALPRHLAEVAAAEYVAVRSMFLWLAGPDALSPFQDDIRDA
jgi:hypothetical protein